MSRHHDGTTPSIGFLDVQHEVLEMSFIQRWYSRRLAMRACLLGFLVFYWIGLVDNRGIFDGLTVQGPVKILVLYSYFETESTHSCEKIMKRTNLATFVRTGVLEGQHISYMFTLGGNLPDAVEFYRSIGLTPPFGDDILPRFANVQSRIPVRSDVPDLCQHAHAFKSVPGTKQYSHVVFMNDGVRGPFEQRPPRITLRSIREVPSWIHDHLILLHSEPNVGAVGSVLSCELTLHLQGWFVLLRAPLFSKHVHIFEETCDVKAWSDAINKETAFSDAILRDGLKLGTYFPVKVIVGQDQRINIGPKLYSCMNPLTAFRQLHGQNAKVDLHNLRFLKVGGGFYRYDILTNATKGAVSQLTSDALGVDHTNYYCFRDTEIAKDFRMNTALGSSR